MDPVSNIISPREPPPPENGVSHLDREENGTEGNSGNAGRVQLAGAESFRRLSSASKASSCIDSNDGPTAETPVGNAGSSRDAKGLRTSVGIGTTGAVYRLPFFPFLLKNRDLPGGVSDHVEDRMLEERVFQTKWENDCLIKAYTAITLQNLSLGGLSSRLSSLPCSLLH